MRIFILALLLGAVFLYSALFDENLSARGAEHDSAVTSHVTVNDR